MHFTKKHVQEKRANLIKALNTKKIMRFPGAYNPLCAKLIAEIDSMVFIFLEVLCLMT